MYPVSAALVPIHLTFLSFNREKWKDLAPPQGQVQADRAEAQEKKDTDHGQLLRLQGQQEEAGADRELGSIYQHPELGPRSSTAAEFRSSQPKHAPWKGEGQGRQNEHEMNELLTYLSFIILRC